MYKKNDTFGLKTSVDVQKKWYMYQQSDTFGYIWPKNDVERTKKVVHVPKKQYIRITGDPYRGPYITINLNVHFFRYIQSNVQFFLYILPGNPERTCFLVHYRGTPNVHFFCTLCLVLYIIIYIK